MSALSAPEGSGVHDASTGTLTSSSTSSLEYQSVATPSLVSSVCKLIQNLVCLAPEDALIALQQEGILKSLIG